MLGSAAQNIIALTDSIFLYHLSDVDFAAIGLVSVFYLTINAIGFGFSKGGQIMIARRFGEKKLLSVGSTFRTLVIFELALAGLMFLFLWYVTPWLFHYLIQSKEVYQKCLDYLIHRSWGVFFAYLGLCMVALYMGISRSRFIVINTVILASVNIFLDYVLVYGYWGFPQWGIKGAGLASSCSEVIAVLIFALYILYDKKIRPMNLLGFQGFQWDLLKSNLRISSPIVIQYGVGVGSWFVFFLLIEKMGEEPLAITNLGRVVYLLLSIPCWGFASGVNTLVSNALGRGHGKQVLPIIQKTAIISFISTLLFALPVIILPQFILYPILGREDMALVVASQPVLYVILFILLFFSIASIYFNGLSGTGATFFALKMQSFSAVVYMGMLFIFVFVIPLSLEWVWSLEIAYWLLIFLFSFYYLRTRKWKDVVV
jgi:putative MATE family efflux protein